MRGSLPPKGASLKFSQCGKFEAFCVSPNYNILPTKIEIEQALESPTGMEPDEFARRLYQTAQNFASYIEDYAMPTHLTGSSMNAGQYNSNSYVAGLLHSVMGTVPLLNLLSEDGTQYQAPGLETPIPDSYFRNAP